MPVACFYSATLAWNPTAVDNDGKADGEAQHQGRAEREFLELKTEQQDGDGRRARDQATRQAEQRNLPGGYLSTGKSPLDVPRMSALMCILKRGLAGRLLLAGIAMDMSMPVMMVVVVMVMIIVTMPVRRELVLPRAPQHPSCNTDHNDGRCELKIRF